MTNLVHIDLFLRSRLEFKQVSFHARKRCWDSIFKRKTYSQARKFGGSKQVTKAVGISPAQLCGVLKKI